MKLIRQLMAMVIVAILFYYCAEIFFSPDAYTLADNHKNIAIIPPTVSISAEKNSDAEAMMEQQLHNCLSIEFHSIRLKGKVPEARGDLHQA